MNELSGSPQQAATLLYFYMYISYLVFSLSLFFFDFYFMISLRGKCVHFILVYLFVCVCCCCVPFWPCTSSLSCLFHVLPHIYRLYTLRDISRLVNFEMSSWFWFFFLLHSLLFWTTHTHREREGKGATRIYVRVNTCVKVTSLSGVKANWWKEWDEVGGFSFFFFPYHFILFF